MDTRLELNAQMNTELRRARTWLLVVGLLMFVMDLVIIYAMDGVPPEAQQIGTAISAGVLAIFLALWWFTPKKPKLCLGLGLVVFWGIQILNAIDDPTMLYKGIIVKIFFTVALVKGLQSASRVEDLRARVAQVFE